MRKIIVLVIVISMMVPLTLFGQGKLFIGGMSAFYEAGTDRGK